MSKITSPPDSMDSSAPVNIGNAPAGAMDQSAYSASVQAAMKKRIDGLAARGAVRGKPYHDQGDGA
jgi:hypothetical protein